MGRRIHHVVFVTLLAGGLVAGLAGSASADKKNCKLVKPKEIALVLGVQPTQVAQDFHLSVLGSETCSFTVTKPDGGSEIVEVMSTVNGGASAFNGEKKEATVTRIPGLGTVHFVGTTSQTGGRTTQGTAITLLKGDKYLSLLISGDINPDPNAFKQQQVSLAKIARKRL